MVVRGDTTDVLSYRSEGAVDIGGGSKGPNCFFPSWKNIASTLYSLDGAPGPGDDPTSKAGGSLGEAAKKNNKRSRRWKGQKMFQVGSARHDRLPPSKFGTPYVSCLDRLHRICPRLVYLLWSTMSRLCLLRDLKLHLSRSRQLDSDNKPTPPASTSSLSYPQPPSPPLLPKIFWRC